MSVERSTTATPTGLLFAFIALNFPSSNAHCASVRFEFDVCTYANSQTVQFKYSWSLGDQVSILVRRAVSDLSFEITIFQQCFMHIYPFRSEESTKNGSRRQMSKKWSKMANQLPLTAANAMALASLRDFILFNFLFASLTDLHFISVYKLPFLRYFSPYNERFSRLLFEVENYRRPTDRR